MKALLAASQCPHCGHLFELRDSFGELLPLAHCPTCDSDYPLKRGECKWCGTKPEGFRIAPYAWKGVGVLAFIGMAWGAWLADRSNAEEASRALTQADDSTAGPPPRVDSSIASGMLAQAESADTDTELTPTDVVLVDAVPVESTGVVTPTTTPTSADTMPVPAPPTVIETMPPRPPTAMPEPPPTRAPTAIAETPPARTPTAISEAPPTRSPTTVPESSPIRAPSTAPETSPARARTNAARTSTAPGPTTVADSRPVRARATVSPRARPSSKPTAPPRRRVRWVHAVARRWVPVRANATHTSRLVASVGPDTRVQLGEVRGTWIRLRTRGMYGWVDRRVFFAR